MNFVIDAEQCVACLACVRVCPTDAVAVAGDEPLLLQIVDEACIRCGQCLPACPHGAVRVSGEIGKALAIASQGDGILILSPEAAAHFYPATPEQVINACYAAGFRSVTRGVIGDELVAATGEGQRLIGEGETEQRERGVRRRAGEIPDRRDKRQRATAHERTHGAVRSRGIEQPRHARPGSRTLLGLAHALPGPARDRREAKNDKETGSTNHLPSLKTVS